jgi:hypothetical protein
MRSKTDYVFETNEKGKQAPRKIDLAPVMRDEIKCEFTTVFDVGINHWERKYKNKNTKGSKSGLVGKYALENIAAADVVFLTEGIPDMLAADAAVSESVKIVRLPYPITDNHGKDLRDYLNEGHTIADLLALADIVEPLEKPATTYTKEKQTAALKEILDKNHITVSLAYNPNSYCLIFYK